ncbi:hypothetical protein RSAG8_10596, partial [Rhizoctonia solani AG-8 WAC10335]
MTALTAHLKYLVVTNPSLLESTWFAFLRAASGSTQPPYGRPGATIGVATLVSLLYSIQTSNSSLGASIRTLVDLEGAETAPRNEADLSLLALVKRWL